MSFGFYLFGHPVSIVGPCLFLFFCFASILFTCYEDARRKKIFTNKDDAKTVPLYYFFIVEIWRQNWVKILLSKIYVTSFSSISYYSNVRLISNILFRTNTFVLYFRYPCFNSWASPHTFSFQATQYKQSRHFCYEHALLSDLVLKSFSNEFRQIQNQF